MQAAQSQMQAEAKAAQREREVTQAPVQSEALAMGPLEESKGSGSYCYAQRFGKSPSS